MEGAGQMRTFLISGEWLWPHYQEACAKALESIGHTTIKFGWYQHFFSVSPGKEPRFRSFIAQRQNKYVAGPLISKINHDFLSVATENKPDVVWMYNDTHIVPGTIKRLRKLLPKTLFAQYANDNPWAPNQSAFKWRHFKKSVSLFDINFYYRLSNKLDLLRAGAKRTELLRSYYIPQETFPVERRLIEDEFRSDVVFVGHYEDDGRLAMLSAIAETGCKLRLFGTGWNAHLARLPVGHVLKGLYPVTPVRGKDYRKAICGSRMALSFLSKLNEDTYTRRNFEIPAMKTFMLSEHSDDLANLFAEGIEAEFFRSKDELLSKIDHYLRHDAEITRLAARGYERITKDGHDVVTRMKQFSDRIDQTAKEGVCAES